MLETHHPSSGFKKFFRRLRNQYKCQINKDDLSAERLSQASLWIFGGPREKFNKEEFQNLKDYIAGGGNILVFMGEGGEQRYGTNINYLTEEYGISVTLGGSREK